MDLNWFRTKNKKHKKSSQTGMMEWPDCMHLVCVCHWESLCVREIKIRAELQVVLRYFQHSWLQIQLSTGFVFLAPRLGKVQSIITHQYFANSEHNEAHWELLRDWFEAPWVCSLANYYQAPSVIVKVLIAWRNYQDQFHAWQSPILFLWVSVWSWNVSRTLMRNTRLPVRCLWGPTMVYN